MYKALVLIFLAISLGGCSTQASTSANSDSAKHDPNSLARPGSDPSGSSNTGSSNENHTPTLAERREKYLEKSRISSPSSGPLPPPQFRPARDNSMVSTTMNSNGAVIETRVFKDNPQIARVEMTWLGPKDNSLKIFLRNGRVVVANADNIENLGSTPLSLLLEKAGIKAAK